MGGSGPSPSPPSPPLFLLSSAPSPFLPSSSSSPSSTPLGAWSLICCSRSARAAALASSSSCLRLALAMPSRRACSSSFFSSASLSSAVCCGSLASSLSFFAAVAAAAASTAAVSLMTPSSSALASSRRSQPARRISRNCESSRLGQREKRRPDASGRVSASVMKRKTSSFGSSAQVGSSSAESFSPPPSPPAVSEPARITVYSAPHASSAECSASWLATVGLGPSAPRWTNTRRTPAALACASCPASAASSALTASHVVAPAIASPSGDSLKWRTSMRPE
mmetsp:Transcript_23443/g.79143  ORF Transcript_23443/g.79143 Transcript_23443/m.79143 type:complete len:281 (-) Transcript_23443:343-1185(-)